MLKVFSIQSRKIKKHHDTLRKIFFCLCWTIFLHSITLLSFLLSSSSFEAIQKKHFSCRVITHALSSWWLARLQGPVAVSATTFASLREHLGIRVVTSSESLKNMLEKATLNFKGLLFSLFLKRGSKGFLHE